MLCVGIIGATLQMAFRCISWGNGMMRGGGMNEHPRYSPAYLVDRWVRCAALRFVALVDATASPPGPTTSYASSFSSVGLSGRFSKHQNIHDRAEEHRLRKSAVGDDGEPEQRKQGTGAPKPTARSLSLWERLSEWAYIKAEGETPAETIAKNRESIRQIMAQSNTRKSVRDYIHAAGSSTDPFGPPVRIIKRKAKK